MYTMEVSLTNLLEVDNDHFEVISTLEELKKSKLLVLESHCALNNNLLCNMNNNRPPASTWEPICDGKQGNYYCWPYKKDAVNNPSLR